MRRGVGVGRATVSLARTEQITFLAAAIAYYAFASVVPLLLLTAVVASVVGGEAFARDLVSFLGQTLTPASQDVLLSTLTTTTGRGSATLVGLVALLWSSLKVFRALDTAFSIVYGEPAEEGFLDAVVDGAVALGAVGVAITASVAFVAVLTLFEVPFLERLGVVVEVFLLTAAFYPLYYLFPGVDVSYREALPGALFAASGWTALSTLFQLYVSNAASFALWGVLGAALVVVTWLYVGALCLLVGAALNATLAGQTVPDVESDVASAVDRHLQNAGRRQSDSRMVDDRDESEDAADGEDESRDVVDSTGDADATTGARATSTVDDGGASAPGDGDGDEGDSDSAPGGDGDDSSAGAPSGDDGDGGDGGKETIGGDDDDRDAAALREEIEELRAELESFEDDVESRTLHRDDVEGDLKRYVRRRVRRGKARGWGPYLVLLYGTAMTLGAFYTPYLSGGWAIFAMVVIWLSTLGLYVLMVLAGIGFNLLSVPGRLRDVVGDWRS
ncbi:YihY/virulence factor BrkB family protein [Halorubellus sp. JP-L1]|nr:YihY/virulence factor BrkB family protein [Halorubellus sp. JP-L1]